MSQIEFCSAGGEHCWLSNFAPYPIRLGSQLWPTSEHYFQAQRFADPARKEEIRRAPRPGIAARLGRDRAKKLRRDWESVKVSVMRETVLAKFSQHPELRASLLATGDALIVEHTERDAYWGDGGDGSGRNLLGRILMETRRRLGESARTAR